jgi:hypothetical protein
MSQPATVDKAATEQMSFNERITGPYVRFANVRNGSKADITRHQFRKERNPVT